jgi:hypothetical protein
MTTMDRKELLTTEPSTCASCGCRCVCPCTCSACMCAGAGDRRATDGPPLPILTPFLVVPCRPGDPGTRPLPTSQAIYSDAIRWTVANPDAPGGWRDFQLRVSCAVANLGPVASPAAMIEFYTGTDIAIRHKLHATLTPAEVQARVELLGRGSFTAPPGTVTTVTCPTPWVPGAYKAALQGILVQVRDLFTDPWTAPFDAFDDRHVGRNDDTMPRVWNTGVNFNAAPLAPGAQDQHWELVAGPGIGAPQSAVVVADQHPGGAYFGSSDSAWIWQDVAGAGDVGSPYTFRLQIDLSGLDPRTVTIGGAWGVDNDGTILLNGQVPTGTGTFSLTNAAHDNYNVAHPFSITGGFVAGLNTLNIQVTNADGPAAMNVAALRLAGTPV